MIRALPLALACLTATLPALSFAATLGERLGFAPDAKLLILHADDLGSIQSADQAFADLRDHGLVSSGSIMFPCPQVSEAVAYAHAHPDSDEGVHITLNSEWKDYRWGPVADAQAVPSIVDRKGFLPENLWSLFLFGKQADAAREMEAQIRAAFDAGLSPTHIDTHMGAVFLHPGWLKTYLHLGRAYHLPPMLPRWSEELRQHYGTVGGGALSLYAPKILAEAEASGFLLLDYLYDQPLPKENTFASRKQAYIDMIRNLKPGVTQFVFHPAYADANFAAKILKTDPEQVLRDWEARIFQDTEVRAELERQGVKLIGWRKIQEAYDWQQVRDLP